jgi:hypothetical protein
VCPATDAVQIFLVVVKLPLNDEEGAFPDVLILEATDDDG